jgi:hypothetical protein
LTPLNEPYGLTGLLIDLDDGMYESINIHQMSTFNWRKYVGEGMGIRFNVTKHELMVTLSNRWVHPYGFYDTQISNVVHVSMMNLNPKAI